MATESCAFRDAIAVTLAGYFDERSDQEVILGAVDAILAMPEMETIRRVMFVHWCDRCRELPASIREWVEL